MSLYFKIWWRKILNVNRDNRDSAPWLSPTTATLLLFAFWDFWFLFHQVLEESSISKVFSKRKTRLVSSSLGSGGWVVVLEIIKKNWKQYAFYNLSQKSLYRNKNGSLWNALPFPWNLSLKSKQQWVGEGRGSKSSTLHKKCKINMCKIPGNGSLCTPVER